MITAHDLNDTRSPRIARFLPLFEAAATPEPENSDWAAWQTLMGSGGEDAMSFKTDSGFATVSSSLLALADPLKPGVKPVWLFAPGAPDQTAYDGVEL